MEKEENVEKKIKIESKSITELRADDSTESKNLLWQKLNEQKDLAKSKPIIKRKALVFRCDYCGEMFEGEGAQEKYNEHIENLDWDEVSHDLIKEPKTMSCIETNLVDDYEKEISDKAKVDTGEGSIDDLLSEMEKVSENDMSMTTQYICVVCQIKAKDSSEYNWTFDTVKEFDQHLWSAHGLAVNREPEFKVEKIKEIKSSES